MRTGCVIPMKGSPADCSRSALHSATLDHRPPPYKFPLRTPIDPSLPSESSLSSSPCPPESFPPSFCARRRSYRCAVRFLTPYPDQDPAPAENLSIPFLNSYSPAGVVDDLADDTTDVTVLLSKVEVAETSGVLVVVGVGLEDTTRLPLGTDNTLFGVSNCALTSSNLGYVHPFSAEVVSTSVMRRMSSVTHDFFGT